MPKVPDIPDPPPPQKQVIVAPVDAQINPQDPAAKLKGLTTLAGGGIGAATNTGASLIGGQTNTSY